MPVVHSDWAGFRAATDAALAAAPGQPLALLQLHLRRLRGLRGLLGEEGIQRCRLEVQARVMAALRPQDGLLVLGEADLLLLLPDLLSPAHARLAVQALQRALEPPIEFDGLRLRLLPELGLACHPAHGEDAEGLQRAASAAVGLARQAVGAWAEAGGPPAEPLHAELAQALHENALQVVFQPVRPVANLQVCGFEALARWTHPQSGQPVPPDVFVPLAEQAGLAPELTRWSLQAALRAFAPLRPHWPQAYCALNLSARAFDDSALVEQIAAALAIWEHPPQALMLEITETALLAEPRRHARQLAQLRELGVRLALDDFGQGYSSFGYLQFLEVDVLKIDRRFVDGLHAPRQRGLVQSMIELAQRLGMQAVAEGVETAEVLAALAELGCDQAQGWLLGRPAPAAHWLKGGA